jgi:hypothetical protein
MHMQGKGAGTSEARVDLPVVACCICHVRGPRAEVVRGIT